MPIRILILCVLQLIAFVSVSGDTGLQTHNENSEFLDHLKNSVMQNGDTYTVIRLLERVFEKLEKLEKENAHKDALLEELSREMMEMKAKIASKEKNDHPTDDGGAAGLMYPAIEPEAPSSSQHMQTFGKKRSDDAGTLEPVINQMNEQITQMTAKIHSLEAKEQATDARFGTAYVRWGHGSCPASSELVYSGIVGGAPFNDGGGGANYLCLMSTPVFDSHPLPAHNTISEISGSEYQTCDEASCNTTPACAVCLITRSAAIMVPGTNACPSGWTREYSGYIMANHHAYTGGSEFICVDSLKENIHTSQQNDDQNLMYYAVFKCGALPCPPYAEHKTATCVVCSK